MTQEQAVAAIAEEVRSGSNIKSVGCPHNSGVNILIVGNGDPQKHKLVACQALNAMISSGQRSGCRHLFCAAKGCPFLLGDQLLG